MNRDRGQRNFSDFNRIKKFKKIEMHYFNSPSIWLIGKICIVWTIRDKETYYSKGVRRFPPPPLLADVSQSLVRRPNKFTIPRKLLEIIRRINPKAIPLSLEDLYT